MPRKRRSGARSRRLEYMNAMAAGLAHEVKNPLSTMSVNLQLLAEEFASPETPRERRTAKRASLLLGEVKRLDAIVNDFLKLARGYELKEERVDVELLVTGLLRFVEPEHERLGVQVRTSFDPGARFVVADPEFLRLSLMNLVLNAQQAMAESGGGLFLETRRKAGNVEIRVTDTGPGIPPEQLEKVFMPFYSTKPGGTGIGLPMTRRIVEELGGEVRVMSTEGRGTRFVVALPAAPMQLPGGPAPEAPAGEGAP